MATENNHAVVLTVGENSQSRAVRARRIEHVEANDWLTNGPRGTDYMDNKSDPLTGITQNPQHEADTPGGKRDVEARKEGAPHGEHDSPGWGAASPHAPAALHLKSIPRRKLFPEAKPEVCFFFLSCGRYELLRETYRTWIVHLETNEPQLRYEVVWVDSGHDPEHKPNDLLEGIQAEKQMFNRMNYGMDFAFNEGMFGGCRAPYVIQLEEDWYYNLQRAPAPWITWGVRALEQVKKARSITFHEYVCPSGPWGTHPSAESLTQVLVGHKTAKGPVNISAGPLPTAGPLAKGHHNGPLLLRSSDLSLFGPRREDMPPGGAGPWGAGLNWERQYEANIVKKDSDRFLMFLQTDGAYTEYSCDQTKHMGGDRSPVDAKIDADLDKQRSPCHKTVNYPAHNMPYPSSTN